MDENIILSKKFGKLKVLEILPPLPTAKSKYHKRCKCICDCGKERVIRLDAIIYNWTKSCGCLQKESGKDEFTPFRFFLANARKRTKKRNVKLIECNLNLLYLKQLWEKQGGICPYTGIKMELAEVSNKRTRINMNPAQASLDRIDSSKGYIKGNVEYVCVSINYAKNGFTKEKILDFINKIRNN